MGDFSIQISSNLVDMIINDTEKPKSKPRRNRSKGHTSDDYGMPKGRKSDGWPRQPPPHFLPVIPPVHSANPELDTIRTVLRDSERVVEKLQTQENNMRQEVTQRAKDLHDKEFKLPYRKPMPCLVESEACFQCYKDYPNDRLKCARLIKKFGDCNGQARQQMNSVKN